MNTTIPSATRIFVVLCLANIMLSSCGTLVNEYVGEVEELQLSEIQNEERINVIEGLEFKRGSMGEGLILIDLSSSNIVTETRLKSYYSVLFEFHDTELTSSISRNLDVEEFGTPVLNIYSSNKGRIASVLVETVTPDFDLISSQVDDLLTLEFVQMSKAEIEKRGE